MTDVHLAFPTSGCLFKQRFGCSRDAPRSVLIVASDDDDDDVLFFFGVDSAIGDDVGGGSLQQNDACKSLIPALAMWLEACVCVCVCVCV